jgi:ribosomal protein L7/L12
MQDCPKCGATLAAGEQGCRYCGAGAARPPSGVEILDVGPNVIMVIKVVHSTLKCGLKEAKDRTEGPMPLRITVDAARAPQMVADLIAAGARARLA